MSVGAPPGPFKQVAARGCFGALQQAFTFKAAGQLSSELAEKAQVFSLGQPLGNRRGWEKLGQGEAIPESTPGPTVLPSFALLGASKSVVKAGPNDIAVADAAAKGPCARVLQEATSPTKELPKV